MRLSFALSHQHPSGRGLVSVSSHPFTPAQKLIADSHFFRSHIIGSHVEITAGWFSSISQNRAEDKNHVLWIDSLHPRWVTEPLNEIPNPNSPLLKVLPPVHMHSSGPERLEAKPKNVNPDIKLAHFLEDFQRRYFEAQYEIRQLELKLIDLQKNGGSKEDFREIKLRIEALANRENHWIKQLTQTLATHSRTSKRK